jgi:hypothetical protein
MQGKFDLQTNGTAALHWWFSRLLLRSIPHGVIGVRGLRLISKHGAQFVQGSGSRSSLTPTSSWRMGWHRAVRHGKCLWHQPHVLSERSGSLLLLSLPCLLQGRLAGCGGKSISWLFLQLVVEAMSQREVCECKDWGCHVVWLIYMKPPQLSHANYSTAVASQMN